MSSMKDLKTIASSLGITYSPNIGEATLAKKIEDYNLAQEKVNELKGLDKNEIEKALRDEALQQVRVKINCINPAKAKHQGDWLMASNSLIGTIKKFVPFNTEWHIPQILLNVAEEKKFTQHDARKNVRRLIKEYQIEVLPALTIEELDDLRHEQNLLDKSQGD